MRRSIAAAAAAATLIATLVACGGSDGGGDAAGPTQNTGSGATAEPGGEQSADATPSSSQSPVGKLGDTLRLEGLADNLDTAGTVQADITLKRYEDHTQPSLDIFAPSDGNRLVAVEFTIVNTGTGTYSDLANQGTKVIDSTGQEHAAKPGDPTVGESMGVNILLRPGKQTTGWVIVDVPKDAKITAVTYQMDATGVDKERTGTWNLN